MPTEKRRFEPAVIERLFREPYRFEYFQAVRMLELWLKRHGRPRHDVAAHDVIAQYVRFQNSTSLSFPASQLEAIQPEPRDIERGAQALGKALQEASLDYIRVTPSFMGLLSGHGVLPAHYTERIAEHQHRHADEGPRALLDTFSNRSLALFYGAWRKYRLHFKYQLDGHDAFLPLLLALAGLGHAALRGRLAHDRDGALLDESIGYFAASIRQRPPSAVQMGRVLSEYFGQPVRVEQFVGAWYDVPPAQQTVLGRATAVLGTSAMAGIRVWQRDLRLRIVIGPLDHAGFTTFLPGGLASRALKSLLGLLAGVTLEYEIELILRGAEVRSTILGPASGGRLGWDAYLVTGPQAADRGDVRYDVQALQGTTSAENNRASISSSAACSNKP
jgi:type VI secretion system protein ImpH